MMRLREGIFLEKSNELLPWWIARDEAWNIGQPLSTNLVDPTDRTRIHWDDVILDGLECRVFAYLPDELNSLRYVTVSIGHDDTVRPDPFRTYLRVFNHLTERLGPPYRVICKPHYGPILIWKHQGCCIGISIYERYGEGFEMRIRKYRWFGLGTRCS